VIKIVIIVSIKAITAQNVIRIIVKYYYNLIFTIRQINVFNNVMKAIFKILPIDVQNVKYYKNKFGFQLIFLEI
jgi:hypothetical protein